MGPRVDTTPHGVEALDQKFFHTSKAITNRGQNGGPPGRYHPARCGNQNLEVVEPAEPGEDRFSSPDQKSVSTMYYSNEPGTKTVVPRADIAPHGGIPNPIG